MAWTLEENNFLRQFYPDGSKETIMSKIHRPWPSIITQACKLGIKRNIRSDSFTLKEEQLLKDIFEHNTKKHIIEKFKEAGFKRSTASIFLNARRLGLKRDPELIKQDMIEGGKKAPTPSNIILWTEDEDNKLRIVYPNGDQEEIMKMFPGRTWKAIREHTVRLGLSRSKEKIDEDRAKHFKKNLGVTSTWQLEKVKEKSRQTNLERRGVEYPTQSPEVRDKVKKIVQERYGVDNVFQSENIKEDIKKKNLEKYGVENPNQNPEVHARGVATNQRLYGVDNPFQMTDRVQKGMTEKYGDTCPLRVPEIKKKQQATNIERYGFPTPAQNKKIQEKTEQTNIVRYGTSTPFQNEDIKLKIKKTNLKIYGVENPAKNEDIKKKIKATTFARFGVESFLQLKEIREKAYAVIKKNKSFCKSKEEIKFMSYLKIYDPNIETHVEHPIIKNVMDYYMPNYNLWVQYDGVYWHGKLIRNQLTRHAIKIKKTMERDKYQNEHVPNLIRFWSDDVKFAEKNDSIQNLIERKIKEKTNTSHQYIKKQEFLLEDIKTLEFDHKITKAKDFILTQEPFSTEILEFIIKYEWLGTIGVMPKWCFTARLQNKLGGVVLINEPITYSKILKEHTPIYEALIQRGATASWAPKNLGSRLIMFSCNWMVKNTEKRAFVAYADPRANELGVIYQACNFEYLGNNFGTSILIKHPLIKKDKWISPQSLKRTSAFKKWCKNNNIIMHNSWFKENGFKDLTLIPDEIKTNWYKWNQQILLEAEKIKVDKKHKYVIVLNLNKKEKIYINSLKNYTCLPYPKKLI